MANRRTAAITSAPAAGVARQLPGQILGICNKPNKKKRDIPKVTYFLENKGCYEKYTVSNNHRYCSSGGHRKCRTTDYAQELAGVDVIIHYAHDHLQHTRRHQQSYH